MKIVKSVGKSREIFERNREMLYFGIGRGYFQIIAMNKKSICNTTSKNSKQDIDLMKTTLKYKQKYIQN